MPVLEYVWEGAVVMDFDDFCTTGVHTIHPNALLTALSIF